jgi:hypothetical protein
MHTKSDMWRKIILTECIARTLKNKVRDGEVRGEGWGKGGTRRLVRGSGRQEETRGVQEEEVKGCSARR